MSDINLLDDNLPESDEPEEDIDLLERAEEERRQQPNEQQGTDETEEDIDLLEERETDEDINLLEEFEGPETTTRPQEPEQEGVPDFQQDPNFITGEAGEGFSLPTRVAGEAIQESASVLPSSVQNIASSGTEGAATIFRGTGRFLEHVGQRTGVDTIEDSGNALEEQTEEAMQITDPETEELEFGSLEGFGETVTTPEFYTGTIPKALGSTAPFIAGGLAISGITGSGIAGTGIAAAGRGALESATNTGLALEVADREGLSQEKKNEIAEGVFAKNFALNTALGFGEIGLIKGVGNADQKILSSFFDGDIPASAIIGSKVAGSAAQEGVQESVQGTIRASELPGIEQTWEQFFEEGALGALAGAPFGAAGGIDAAVEANIDPIDSVEARLSEENQNLLQQEVEETEVTVENMKERAQENDQETIAVEGMEFDAQQDTENIAKTAGVARLVGTEPQFAAEYEQVMNAVSEDAKASGATRTANMIENIPQERQLGVEEVTDNTQEMAQQIQQEQDLADIKAKRALFRSVRNNAEPESISEETLGEINENIEVLEQAQRMELGMEEVTEEPADVQEPEAPDVQAPVQEETEALDVEGQVEEQPLQELEGIGESTEATIQEAGGIETVGGLAQSEPADIAGEGLSESRAETLISRAQEQTPQQQEMQDVGEVQEQPTQPAETQPEAQQEPTQDPVETVEQEQQTTQETTEFDVQQEAVPGTDEQASDQDVEIADDIAADAPTEQTAFENDAKQRAFEGELQGQRELEQMARELPDSQEGFDTFEQTMQEAESLHDELIQRGQNLNFIDQNLRQEHGVTLRALRRYMKMRDPKVFFFNSHRSINTPQRITEEQAQVIRNWTRQDTPDSLTDQQMMLMERLEEVYLSNEDIRTPDARLDLARELIPIADDLGLLSGSLEQQVTQMEDVMNVAGPAGGAEAFFQARTFSGEIDGQSFRPLSRNLDEGDFDLTEEQIRKAERHRRNWNRRNQEKLEKLQGKGLTVEKLSALAEGIEMSQQDIEDMVQNEITVIKPQEMFKLGSYIKTLEAEIAEAKEQGDYDRSRQLRSNLDVALAAWKNTGTAAGQLLASRMMVGNATEMTVMMNSFLEKIHKLETEVPQIDNMDQYFDVDQSNYERYLERSLERILEEEGVNVNSEQWQSNNPEYNQEFEELDVRDRQAVEDFIEKWIEKTPGASQRTVKDWADWYWHNNVLSGPRTGLRNIVGGFLKLSHRAFMQKPGEFLYKITRRGAQKVFNASQMIMGRTENYIEHDQTLMQELATTMDEQVETVKALGSAFRPALENAKNAYINGLPTRIGGEVDYHSRDPAPNWVSTTFGAPLRAMAFQDQFFRVYNAEIVKRSEAARLANERHPNDPDARDRELKTLIEEPEPETIEKMAQAGKEGIFQDSLETTDTSTSLATINPFRLMDQGKNYLENNEFENRVLSGTYWTLARFLQYSKTAGNIMEESAKTMGGGAITGLMKEHMASQQMEENPEIAEQLREAAREDFGKTMFAFPFAMAMASLYMSAFDGAITGPGPDNFEDKKRLYNLGWIPYQIRLPGLMEDGMVGMGYKYIDPYSPLLAMAGSYHDQTTFQQQAPASTKAFNISKDVMKFFVDKSYNRGINLLGQLMWGNGASTTTMQQLAANPLKGFMPLYSAVLTVRQGRDNVMRDPQTFMDQFYDAIPGLSETVQPKLNEWDQQVTLSQPFGGIGTISPGTITAVQEEANNVQENISVDKFIRNFSNEIDQNIERALVNIREGREVGEITIDQSLADAVTEQQKNWVIAKEVWSKMKDLEDGSVASNYFNHLKEQGVVTPEVMEAMETHVVLKNKPLFGDDFAGKMHTRDQRLVQFDGRFLSEEVFSRIEGLADPQNRLKKTASLIQFFKATKWSNLEEQERNRRSNELFQNLQELSEERDANLFSE